MLSPVIRLIVCSEIPFTSWFLCSITLLVATPGVARLKAGVLDGIAVLGDSMTDEYQFDCPWGDCTERNWMEQLATSRGLNFGSFSTNDRGEPRRQGYEFNWARGGAVTGDLPVQSAGVAAHVSAGAVSTVFFETPVNELGIYYFEIHDGSLAGDRLLAELLEPMARKIADGLDTLLAAGEVRIVMSNLPDWSIVPAIRPNTTPEGRARVAEATDTINAMVEALAAERSIPVVSLQGLGNLSLRESLALGRVAINPRGTSNDFDSFFLADNLHPGTVVHGLVANAFALAANGAYAAGILPLSDQEILENAGGTPPGGEPTFLDLSEFVTFHPPATDCDQNHLPDPFDIRWGAPDCNESGVPDACELEGNDCDGNSILDSCDIASGSAEDCNRNGIPDSCDIGGGFSQDGSANGVPDECETRFRRGDCNGDGEVRGVVTDAVFLLNFNFLGGPRPSCFAACDANSDGEVRGTVSDAVYLLTFNFLGGPAPPEPFPGCGPGTEADLALGCETAPESCGGPEQKP